MRNLKITIFCLLAFLIEPQINCAQVLNNYTNSWIGNTFGTPASHIQHSIDNLYVTPSGKIATITSWDEGGHNVAIFDSNGVQIGVPEQSGTGSYGRFSGSAVFMDDQFVYQLMTQKGCDGNNGNLYFFPICGTQWFCVRRFLLDGSGAPFVNGKGYDGSFLIVTSDTTDFYDITLNGITIFNKELYVSDKFTNTIKVYDAETMDTAVVRTISIGYNGLLDYDSQGNVWCLDIAEQKIVCFSPAGVIQTQQIILPTNKKATAFCVDKINDRILIANNGIDQNILVYSNIFDNPIQTSTFGLTGGVNSGTMGEIAPLKFSEPKGVGIDSLGNIIVGNNGVWQGGARLEKYDNSDSMQWRLNGLIFTDNGVVDPVSESDFYTKELHIKLNLNNSIPGTEWEIKGMTINRFAFPEDDRITDSDGLFWTTTYTRNVAGKKILFISDMYGKSLLAYKFNSALYGEMAVPSVFFGNSENTDAEFIWTDNNNDKLHQLSEYDSTASLNYYSTHIVPDQEGNVWKTNRENGILYFPFQGFDENDNPKYSNATATLFANPNGIYDVKRIEYDNESDALYVTGRSNESVIDSWSFTGDVMAKYSNYLTDPSALPTWIVATPFYEEVPDADINVKAFCTAGDYIFTILLKKGKIIVREKSTGNIVGEIAPTADTDSTSGWADINGAIQAYKRANGEYLIFAEENGFGKIMMYRWCPNGNCDASVIGEINNPEKINVYPNPTNDAIFIDLKSKGKLELFNMFGQLVYSKQNAQGIEKIEMQNLSIGLYLLKTETSIHKIIKH
jgi:uncharacterized protein YuzE